MPTIHCIDLPGARDALNPVANELGRDPFSTGALYGLGSYAMYYRDSGDSAQEKVIGWLLIERLRDANDIVPRLIVTLGGIANSGYRRAFEAVVPHLADRRPAVRAAAIRSLQSISGDDVDAVLASAITSDTEASVSVAAISSAQIREPSDTLIAALASAAEKGSDPPSVIDAWIC